METSRSGLLWVLHKVTKEGYLERVRRGVHKRRTKLPFVPLLRQDVRNLRRELLTRFQTMPFIVYSSEYFSKLQEHPVPNKSHQFAKISYTCRFLLMCSSIFSICSIAQSLRVGSDFARCISRSS